MSKNLSILVNSCDLYESVWDPFFKLFAIQWPDCPYDIYLNTETKSYECDFLNVKTICTGNDVPWTVRLKKALKEIDAEYILFFLEDFFLLDKVDVSSFDKIFRAMQQDPSIGFLFFNPLGIEWHRSHHNINDFCSETKWHCVYRANACIGLWRKEFLLQVLFLDGNPWTFEYYATRLSRIAKYKCCSVHKEYENVLPYSILPELGYGITKRQWLLKNKELFDKYDIDVDFDVLGIQDSQEDMPKTAGNSMCTSPQKKKSSIKETVRKKVKFLKFRLRTGPKFRKYCRQIHQEMYGDK